MTKVKDIKVGDVLYWQSYMSEDNVWTVAEKPTSTNFVLYSSDGQCFRMDYLGETLECDTLGNVFDSESSHYKHKCNCDLKTVLMLSGCKCGGV